MKMIERDSCFFCTSPFQLFAIFSLMTSRKEKADLYIDPQFSEANAFAERIKKTGIFANVKVINSSAIYAKYLSAGPGWKNHIQIASSYLHVKDIANMILLPGVKYNNIFLSSKAYLPRMVQLYYVKERYNCEVNFFDDGAGTYYRNRAHQMKKADERLRRCLFGSKAAETERLNFVFDREVFSKLNKGKAHLTAPLVRFWENEDGKELINSVFGIKESIDIKERLIIIDQPKDELFTDNNVGQINKYYYDLAKTIGLDNTIIKAHPRDDGQRFKGIHYLKNNGVPFELYCLNNDIRDKIIITHSSTAVATPKILFNQEPKVVVLSRLIETKTGEIDLFVDFFEAVKESYSDTERFFIPRDSDEFYRIISTI